MGIECQVMDLLHRYQVKAPRRPLHVNAIDQDKDIMIYGVDLSDIVFDADLRGDDFNIFSLPDPGTYIYTGSVILSEQVADTDKEYFPVFVRQKFM